MISEEPSKKVRIAMGVAGFVVLAGSTPCVLGLYRGGYAGTGDSVGMFGLAGLVLFVLFVGISLLYQGLKSPSKNGGA